MSCKCAKFDSEDGRWQCSITGDGCVYLIPSQKACSEQYVDEKAAEERYQKDLEKIRQELNGD